MSPIGTRRESLMETLLIPSAALLEQEVTGLRARAFLRRFVFRKCLVPELQHSQQMNTICFIKSFDPAGGSGTNRRQWFIMNIRRLRKDTKRGFFAEVFRAEPI